MIILSDKSQYIPLCSMLLHQRLDRGIRHIC